jgi:hypothetical protein
MTMELNAAFVRGLHTHLGRYMLHNPAEPICAFFGLSRHAGDPSLAGWCFK